VLVPYRVDENRALLHKCGFTAVDEFFRWCNFASLVAIKGGSAA
jgi:tRNA (cmo5U34)-methyltransferase